MARRNRQKKSPVAAVCSVLGTLLLIIIVAAYLPITIPRAFGYEIYTVISGSMEPAIPTGSLVYVKYIQPEEIQTEDVIAFYASGMVNAHSSTRLCNLEFSGKPNCSFRLYFFPLTT